MITPMLAQDTTAAPTDQPWVKFSQFNGIVMYGIVSGTASWDPETAYAVVRYCWDPDDDPPRRSYRIVPRDDLHDTPPREGWLTAAYP